MARYEDIYHRKESLELMGTMPTAEDLNLDDMSAEENKAFTRYLYSEFLSKNAFIDSLQAQLDATNALLAEIKEELAESNRTKKKTLETNTKLQATIETLTERVKFLEKELKEANKYKKYKELYNLLKKGKFGSNSQQRKKKDINGRDDDKDNWTGKKNAGTEYESESKHESDSNEKSSDPNDTSTTQDTSTESKPKEERDYRVGLKYAKGGVADCFIVHHNDDSKLPEGIEIKYRKCRSVFDTISLTVEHKREYVTYVDAEGKYHTVYIPIEDEYKGKDLQKMLETLNLDKLQTAPKRVPGTRASVDMLVQIVFNTLVMETPAYREMLRMMEYNFKTCRQTLLNWRKAPIDYMKEVLKVLKNLALPKDSIVNCDETWCRVKRKNKYHKGYIWCMVNKALKIVIFFYDEGSRGRKVLTEFIGESELYALQSDAYNVYSFLDDEMSEIIHIGCVAHMRAKFEKASSVGLDKRADYVLDTLGEIYGDEETYRDLGLSPEEIYVLRNSDAMKEKIDNLKDYIEKLLEDPSKNGELMQKALEYAHNNWEQLMAYRKDGRFDIDNSIAERAIRPLTVERKNIMSFGSDAGAEVSALYHTFIATIKQQGKSVIKFFTNLFTAMIEGRTDYENLIPAIIG